MTDSLLATISFKDIVDFCLVSFVLGATVGTGIIYLIVKYIEKKKRRKS